jgi:hypothetical protein
VPINDDERFELYLKEFRPLVPKVLPTEKQGERRAPRMVAWVAAAAAVLGVVALTISLRPDGTRASLGKEQESEVEHLVNTQPLTIRSANALLSTAPSFEAGVDEMAFPPKAAPLPKGEHSAITALGKEETKL